LQLLIFGREDRDLIDRIAERGAVADPHTHVVVIDIVKKDPVGHASHISLVLMVLLMKQSPRLLNRTKEKAAGERRPSHFPF